MGLTTYLYRGEIIHSFTKYHGHPSMGLLLMVQKSGGNATVEVDRWFYFPMIYMVLHIPGGDRRISEPGIFHGIFRS